MQLVGIIILGLMLLWLLLHREKNQETYQNQIAEGIKFLPRLTQHYIGID